MLVAERATADYFEALAKGRDAKTAANWVMGEFFAALNTAGVGIEDSPVSAGALGGLIDLIEDGTISGRIAKDVFAAMLKTGKEAKAIVEEKDLTQITDTGAIEGVVEKVLAENPDKVAAYRAGSEKLHGWFVGQVMKATQGKANPKAVNEILRKKLSG